jgi:MFS family permease
VRGLAYLFRHPRLRLLAAFVTLHCALTMAFLGILPSIAAQHLSGGSATYGVLLTAVGLGAIAGPLALMLFGRRLRDVHVLIAAGVLSGAMLAALGMVTALPLAVAAAVGVGAADSVFMALAYTLAQRMTGEHMRARISSSQIVITAGSMSLLSMGWGALVAPWGPALVLVVPGVAFVAVVAGFLPVMGRFAPAETAA